MLMAVPMGLYQLERQGALLCFVLHAVVVFWVTVLASLFYEFAAYQRLEFPQNNVSVVCFSSLIIC